MYPISYDCLQGMKPRDLPEMFAEQAQTLEALRQWLHDFNLGKAPMPDFPEDIRELVSLYSERVMWQQVLAYSPNR